MPGGDRLTPSDEFSKLPLPLVPTEVGGGLVNWHHHAHPRLDPLLHGEGGRAVRGARIQRTDANGNHFYYHDSFYGPALPTTPEEQFSYTLLAACDYIPEYGLDFPNGKPIKKRLTPDNIRTLRQGDLRPESLHRMRRFIRNYIVDQDLSFIPDSKIEEFLDARRKVQRYTAGQWIVARALEVAIEPINSTYNQARRNGFLRPGIEPKLSDFVLTQLVGKRLDPESMQSRLRTRLAAEVLGKAVRVEPIPVAA